MIQVHPLSYLKTIHNRITITELSLLYTYIRLPHYLFLVYIPSITNSIEFLPLLFIILFLVFFLIFHSFTHIIPSYLLYPNIKILLYYDILFSILLYYFSLDPHSIIEFFFFSFSPLPLIHLSIFFYIYISFSYFLTYFLLPFFFSYPQYIFPLQSISHPCPLAHSYPILPSILPILIKSLLNSSIT